MRYVKALTLNATTLHMKQPYKICKKIPSSKTNMQPQPNVPRKRYSNLEIRIAVAFCCPQQIQTSKSFVNPLSPNSDQHKFSPNKIHRLLRAKSMRINKMITKRKVFDLKSKFSQLIF